MKKIAIIIGILFFSGIAFCEEARFPDYTGYVNDYADILSGSARGKLISLASEIENKTTCQLAIVTIDTTSPLDIETYAVKLFEKWGIGQRRKNNGVLLLVAVKDRAMRIEVGYGLEGPIPDALAKNIIEKSIIPFFKQGDYSAGVIQGIAAISKLIAREYNVEISEIDNMPLSMPSSQSLSIFDFLFILFIIIIVFRFWIFWWFFPMAGSYRRKDGYWHGSGFGGTSGGFGGGFGGFGGGFSGGGGASGRW